MITYSDRARDLVFGVAELRKKWRSCAETQSTWSALTIVGPLFLLAKLVTVLKGIFLARTFGAGADMDAFYIALTLPTGIIGVVSGSLSTALIPIYVHVRELEGKHQASRVFSSISFLSLMLLLGCSAILSLAMDTLLPYLAPGFTASQLALTARLLTWLSPTIAVSGLSLVWSSVLNAERHFGTAALTSTVSPAFLIVASGWFDRRSGVEILAIATFFGAGAELVLLGWELRRQGLGLMPSWNGFNSDIRNVIHQFVPCLAGGLWSSSSAVVDQSMAAALPTGSVAALNYGRGISSAITGVVAQALAIAVLPSFSRLVAVRQWTGVRGLLRTYTWLALGIGLAATVLLTVFSKPLIALLFQRGAFSPSDTATVADIQIAFALQLPAYFASTVVVRLLAALQRNWVRTIGGLGNLILNIVLNYYLMQWYGIAGIALSTSVVCIASSTYLGFMVRRELVSAEMERLNLEIPAEITREGA